MTEVWGAFQISPRKTMQNHHEIASESQAYLESNIILCSDTDSWVKESNGYITVDANGYTRAIVEYTTDIPNCSDLQIYEY